VKRVDHQMTFGTFEEAERFIAARPSEHWRIASADPLTSCVPLEALTDYTPVFRSLGRQSTSSGGTGPSAVQIYEYLGGAKPQSSPSMPTPGQAEIR
jgi:hypothetical protein